MFWSRSVREARRQKVLDELLELDPKDRRGRLELAVVAGAVQPNEIEPALQTVRRLDALRMMSMQIGGRLPGGQEQVRRRTQTYPAGEATVADAILAQAERPAAPEDAPVAETGAISIDSLPAENEPSIAWLRP